MNALMMQLSVVQALVVVSSIRLTRAFHRLLALEALMGSCDRRHHHLSMLCRPTLCCCLCYCKFAELETVPWVPVVDCSSMLCPNGPRFVISSVQDCSFNLRWVLCIVTPI